MVGLGLAVRLSAMPQVAPESFSQLGGLPGLAQTVVLHLSQDPQTQEVTITVRAAPDLESGRRAANWVAQWRFIALPPGTTEAREGLLALLGKENPDLRRSREASRPQELEYPEALERSRLRGRVLLRGLVRPDGTVDALRIRDCTHPAFGAAAVRAVATWQYKPAVWRGQPVTTMLSLQLSFSFPGEEVEPSKLQGRAANAADQEQIEAGAELDLPLIHRYALPPHPWELGRSGPPERLDIGVLIGARGEVLAVDGRRMREDFREHLEAAVRTWRFQPARLNDQRIPFLTRFIVEAEPALPAAVRRALDGRRPVPREEELDRVPQLLAEIFPAFAKPASASVESFWAEVEFLVDEDGLVVATRLLDANDPSFALFVRARAAHSVYETGLLRGRSTPFWIKRRLTADGGVEQ